MEAGVHLSLQDLGLDYIDLYLIHFPIGFKVIQEILFNINFVQKKYFYLFLQQNLGLTAERDENNQIILTATDYVDTWMAMEKLVEKKLVRSIGVSNFNEEMIIRVMDSCKIKPVTNQVRILLFFLIISKNCFCWDMHKFAH